MNSKIYLDNNATTMIDPRVIKVICDQFTFGPANPSSPHTFGRKAKERLTSARESIAHFLSVKPSELFFTSGGTESINFILRGFYSFKGKGHIISSDIEHSSIHHTLKDLEKKGAKVSTLSTGLWGAITPDQIEGAITRETTLIILSAVNSETGVKNPIEAIAKIAHKHNIIFAVDAVAILGKELFSIPEGVSAMAFSSHKCHGPQGVGLAWIKNKAPIDPLITGGNQELLKRAGTENLPGIVGFAKAIEILQHEQTGASNTMKQLRDRLENELRRQIPDIIINGQGPRVVNTSNISFPGIDGELLLAHLDLAGIAVSLGAACSSGALEPSRVLLNMGIARSLAKSAIRFSLCRFNTKEEIDQCVSAIVKITSALSCALINSTN